MSFNFKNAFNFIAQRIPKYGETNISDIVAKNKSKDWEVPLYDDELGAWGTANEFGAQGWWTYDYGGEIDVDDDSPYDNPYIGDDDGEIIRFKYKNSVKIEVRYYNGNNKLTWLTKYNDAGRELETVSYFSTGEPRSIERYTDGSVRNKKSYECSISGDCKLVKETIPGDDDKSYSEIYYGYDGDQRYPKQKSTYPDGRRFGERIVYHPRTDIPQRVIHQVGKNQSDISYDENGDILTKVITKDNGMFKTTTVYDKNDNIIKQNTNMF